MTEDQFIKALPRLLQMGDPKIRRRMHRGKDRRCLVLTLGGGDISFDDLVDLVAVVGTRNIDVVYSPSDPGYSELTPGFPETVEIVVFDI